MAQVKLPDTVQELKALLKETNRLKKENNKEYDRLISLSEKISAKLYKLQNK